MCIKNARYWTYALALQKLSWRANGTMKFIHSHPTRRRLPGEDVPTRGKCHLNIGPRHGALESMPCTSAKWRPSGNEDAATWSAAMLAQTSTLAGQNAEDNTVQASMVAPVQSPAWSSF